MLSSALPVGCGQCIPCRINRRRTWAHRQILESFTHDKSVFVTLTYSDKTIDPEGNLQPPHFTNFLKRLRERIAPATIRYFGCGEYGPQTLRPHYHVNIFGLGVEDHKVIDASWGLGFTSCFDFNGTRANYCAEYVVKKMTDREDWRLDGKVPEFARMSRRPGIGAPAVAIIADRLFKGSGWDIMREKDVPKNLKMGRKTLVLGRYLRHLLREDIGMTDEWKEALKQEWVTEKDVEMFELRLRARGSKEDTAKTLLIEKNLGRIWSAEARSRLPRTRRGL